MPTKVARNQSPEPASGILPKLDTDTCMTEGALEYREAVLRHRLENSPRAIAQRVEAELIKNAVRNAPWLIPMIL